MILNNHSHLNQLRQREGLKINRTSIDAVFNFKVAMRVGKKVKVLWNANKHTFIAKFGQGRHNTTIKIGYSQYDLDDLINLYNVDSQSLGELEGLIDSTGYNGLEHFIVKKLNLKSCETFS